jgi:hypothetical protein
VQPWPGDPSVPVRDFDEFLTADGCTDLLHDLKAYLLGGEAHTPADFAHQWFAHAGRARSWPPGTLAQITGLIDLEIKLSRTGWGDPDIECAQLFNGGPVSVRDHREKR